MASTPPPAKWRTLILLSLAELLGMSVWFSASAVVPALTDAWNLDAAGRSWLTISVQLGFVSGTLGSALLNLADRLPGRRFFAVSSTLAGVFTLLIPLLADGFISAIALRALTGMVLAGVYPVGMKIMATWTREDRGLGIGLLVGALVFGSAAPHLINAFGGIQDWRYVLYLTGWMAVAAGVIALAFIREGPYRTGSPPFNWRHVGEILRDRPTMLANIGYLGHMWELFAMWSWMPVFLLASFEITGNSAAWAAVWSFATIAIGGVGSAAAGLLADRFGRGRVTIASLLVSGLCSLSVGMLFGTNPALVVAVSLVWGFTVVADSAQFSAAVSELAVREHTGTALTLQTSLGFLLTVITIRLIPTLETFVGWRWAFTFLALGPMAGIWAMRQLALSPAARRLAGGRG